MKAKKLPSGMWNVQVYVGTDETGKRIRKSFTAPTKKEAEFLAANFKAHHQEITRDSSAMTLTEAIDKYIEFKGGTISPSTVRGYRIIQRNSFPGLMQIKINKITVQNFQAAINKEIGIKKPKTIKNEVSFITSVIKTYAPSVNLSGLTLQPVRKFNAEVLSLSQVKELLIAIVDDECAVPLLIAMCLGLRISEISALKWADYDKKNKILSITKAIVRNENNKMVEKCTKTVESERFIVVPEFLDLLLRNREGEPDEHILTMSQSAVREHLKKICIRLQIPPMRVHDLRHVNASVMLFLNVPAKYAMERGGWSDIKTMDKIYQFTFEDHKKVIDDRINNFFTDILKAE